MNDILMKCGFTVIASGAFVAQHSMAPEVGAGRPDGEDEKEIHKFAETVKNSTAVENVQVPGNRPYKPEMNMPVAPISLPSCTKCGKCVTVCPTNAISVADGAVITDIEKCILCMACTSYLYGTGENSSASITAENGTDAWRLKERQKQKRSVLIR